jgi:nicotinamidase-related amidase
VSTSANQTAAAGRDFEDHCWKDVISAEVLETYARYRRETYVGDKPAILVIDLFNKVYSGGPGPTVEVDRTYPGACGEPAWAAIEPTVRLLAAARERAIPIIYTTNVPNPGQLRATHRAKLPTPSNEDPWGIRDDFRPAPDDLVITKQRASAFFGTLLQAYLQLNDIDSLVLCGETTSGCVRASAVDGYSHGFHVSIVEECTFDRSPLSHKISLFDLHHKYADVMRLAEVMKNLGQA